MKISEKRKAGSILEREGLALRVLDIARDILIDGSYKNAIKCAGKISVVADACTYESYWEGKMLEGKYAEESRLKALLHKSKESN